MAQNSVLPAPVESEEPRVVSGEVIVPEDLLKSQEKIIKANFVKYEEIKKKVVRSLTIIHDTLAPDGKPGLWRLHKDDKGKQQYTNFGDYLTHAFGWNLTRARALQLIKEDRPLAIEAGQIDGSVVVEKPRTRRAPQITAIKAAEVTLKQIRAVLDDWNERMLNVEEGELKDQLADIHTTAIADVTHVTDDLEQFIEDSKAESETAPANGDEDDEVDEDEEDEENDTE